MQKAHDIEVSIASNMLKSEKEYWKRVLLGEITSTVLPFQSHIKEENKKLTKVLEFDINNDICMKMLKLCKNSDYRLFMVLYSAISILLYRYTNNETVIVEAPINKQENQNESIINTRVPLVNQICPERTYREFLVGLKDIIQCAYDNGNYPINEIYKIFGNEGESPLTDMAVILENIHDTRFLEECKCSTKLFFTRNEDSIHLKINFDSFFGDDFIIRMYMHIECILQEVLCNTNIRISDIDILTDDEKRQELNTFNDTKSDYKEDIKVHEAFEEQVIKAPDKIAVVLGDKKLTYSELNERANGLARTLRKIGVKPDSIVAVKLEKSIEMIVGLIAILKAGGAYLPIDCEYPAERVNYMLENSKASVLLIQKGYEISEFSGVTLDVNDETIYDNDGTVLENVNIPENLAYVIYTSGSTGTPKGVMIEHKQVANLQVSIKEDIQVVNTDNVLQFANSSFDASVWEIFMALLSGAALYIVSKEIINNYEKMANFLKENKITVAFFPPNYLINLIVEEDSSLKTLITGGSATNHELVRRWYNRVNYINAYGPTETTICATMYKCNGSEEKYKSVPIGSAVRNTKIYILDCNQNCQPIGVPGEICISGDGVSRGYLNQPELTREKFINNPFAEGERMYKTGDLGMWTPDGNIEFVGRIDNQVKIRGFRIELGEIENCLVNIDGIKEAAVINKEENGNHYLYAYYISDKKYTLDVLRNELKKKIPNYMIPSYFVAINEMPYSQSGKIDRKALAKSQEKCVADSAFEAPSNVIETKLVNIWNDVLGVNNIGIQDNFFERGGHSLNATLMGARIYKELGVEVPFKEIFKLQTLKLIAQYIESCKDGIFEEIEKIEQKEYYPTSSAQKRMYMLQELDKNISTYNIPIVMKIEGNLDVKKFKHIFKILIDRHESLRTSFEARGYGIIQKVNENIDFFMEYEEAKEFYLEEIIQNFRKPFDLTKAPLIRSKLVKLSDNVYIWMIDMHHIISDGISMGIFMKELLQLYEDNELVPLRVQYKDFSVWQNKMLNSKTMEAKSKYWIEKFKGEIPVLDIPTDFDRPEVQSFEGDVINFVFDKDLTQKIKGLSEKTGASLFMILLSAYNIFLSKYTGQEDIIVGTSIAGRTHVDIQDIIGMFVNTVPVRNYPSRNKSFLEFLDEVKENCLQLYENQEYPFEALVEHLNLTRDVSRNPVFDTVFELQNIDTGFKELKGLKINPYPISYETAKFDILISMVENEDVLEGGLEYCTKLFKRETMKKFINYFECIVRQIAENNEIKISHIDMLGKDERYYLVHTLNSNRMEFDTEETVYSIIEKQAKIFPEKIAVECSEGKMTYKKINDKANQIARFLIRYGLKKEQTVAIQMKRGGEFIATILGVWKAGGAYIPLDMMYPSERVMEILRDSDTQILISSSSLDISKSLEEKYNGIIFKLDEIENILSKESKENLGLKINSRNLAYVIYTSGSTGKPKGAMVEHIGMANHMLAKIRDLKINGDSIIVQNASHCFDISIWQMFAALCCGGKTVVYENTIAMDSKEFIYRVIKDEVTILEVVPSFLSVMLDFIEEKDIKFKQIKYLLVTGEALKANLVKRWFENYSEITLVNAYGPTEASDDITHYFMEDDTKITNIPIGKPLPNFNIYIVDESLHICPIGVKGEIAVSGIGVGRGYLNDEEKTRKVFLKDPFVDGENRRLYLTGDLGRILPDGNIEFIGRKDNQVKIRGYRIELGEIENRIVQCKNVKEVAVTDKEDNKGNQIICAYIVLEHGYDLDPIKEELRKYLPEYMIPGYFIQMDKLPLTDNGKINRNVLEKPDFSIGVGLELEEPRNKVEEKLASIWKEILGIDRVGVSNNFFELGGHSLRATMLSTRIYKELGVEIPLIKIFSNPTIKELSKYIMSKEKSVYMEISTADKKEYYEASSSQKRIYMAQEFDRNSVAYNMPEVMEITGNFNIESVSKSIQSLIERHEALRTSFETKDGRIVQKVYMSSEIKFELSTMRINNESEIQKLINSFVKPFDLSKAPLFRMEILELDKNRYILLSDMHHIIYDGVSADIINKEFIQLYYGKVLKPLRIQYKDFSEWQNDMIYSGKMKKEEKYWLNLLDGDLPVLDLPIDYERPKVKSFEGDSIEVDIGDYLTRELKELAVKEDVTLYMIMLAIYNVLLSKYTGQDDIIVGSPIAGRSHIDLENVVGVFLNILPIRNRPEREKTFREFLHEVKENSLKAFENQNYPFDELVDKLNFNRDNGRNPIFDAMFVMQDNISEEDEITTDFKIIPYNTENKTSKFDLLLDGIEVKGCIYFRLEYRTDLFKRETIDGIIDAYKKILHQIIKDPKVKLKDIMIIDQKEKEESLLKNRSNKKEIENKFSSFDL